MLNHTKSPVNTFSEDPSIIFMKTSIKDTIKVKMQCAAGDLTMQQCIKEIVRMRFSFQIVKHIRKLTSKNVKTHKKVKEDF